MLNYLESEYIEEEKLDIIGIPCIIFKPRGIKGLIPTIIHYHGWSSSKERQRFRSYILASLGYQVVVPDSIYHGERNPLDDYGTDNSIRYFWDTVFQTLKEASDFIDGIIAKENADPHRIGLIGHSMGAITGAGVFAHDSRIKTLVALNGTGAWENFNTILKKILANGENLGNLAETEEKIKELDPINNLDLIISRPILLLNGLEDDVVPIESQEYFYEKARKLYKDKRNIKLIKYKNTKHLISTDMLEDAAKWFKKYL